MLQRAWDHGWTTVPSLNPEVLVRKAVGQAGADPDEDDVGWRSRLEQLCADLQNHSKLNNLGRTLAHGQIVSALSSRFRAHALWRKYQVIEEQRLSAPIIIVGQMRSGSTRMQRLLACDPRLTYTRFYESWNPVPAGCRRPGLDGRKMKAWMGLACARLLNPAFGTMHPTSYNAPDEEIGLHNLSIFGTAFEVQYHVPNYTAAVERDDPVPVYREFRRLLQMLRWLRIDRSDRPWILKVPQFSQDLPALLQVFPDARLIFLSRDLDSVIASSALLVRNQMSLQSDDLDPPRIEREWTRKVRLREARMNAAKTIAEVPQVDVRYQDVSDDWEREMLRVYEMLNLPLSDDVKARMASYLHASQPAHHGRRKNQIGRNSSLFDCPPL
ncbi:sulfotransferase family protein [Sphingosinicella rhizophila]|uniref:Sulfotransferase n=1 Tax=Sphingosinicella rhizophila TaxID=3050082 RepID=A0ABU3Q7K3_9SPHN|nr:sulfotransferase [Sphingosinicella sp. GR2756]MDT9599388.1 sulfotransferase [Sphingosinicella sp. GR2756]